MPQSMSGVEYLAQVPELSAMWHIRTSHRALQRAVNMQMANPTYPSPKRSTSGLKKQAKLIMLT